MKKKDILKQIIANKGSCNWVMDEFRNCNVCQFCPMSKLSKKANGDYKSCYEAICGEHKIDDEGKINEKYYQAALNLLLDISVDEELGLDEEGDYVFSD